VRGKVVLTALRFVTATYRRELGNKTFDLGASQQPELLDPTHL
jgi:hypothetical protein